ncbi:MAG: sigma-54 dependent transcriptional regulator [Verrucomicrobia bacterium]|nr:sigma-54 dependent transcriptional regulator [Verrucomicrobiota bacterium]
MNTPLKGAKILVVDDIAENRQLLSDTLEPEGYRISIAPNGEVALKVAQANPPDLILLDLMMPGMNGFEVCRRLKDLEAMKSIPVIFITADNDTASVVEGFRVGAVDYIAKPFKAEEVLIRTRTHLTNHRLTREIVEKNRELEEANGRLRDEINRRETAESSLEVAGATLSLMSEQEAERWGLEAFVGRSPAMRDVIQEIRKLQGVDTTSVLIRGESGTGKELVARALHHSGRRNGKPFIAVNCAAIPGDLAESLFFGHVKGAFSGASDSRKGYLELADGGTLFLDEIGDMPLNLQAKLLRALEDGSFMPIGAVKEKRADVRLLAATNVKLKDRIADGGFRQDLYFRIAGYDFELKPLRERREDIELFAAHFLKRFSKELNIRSPSLSPEAGEALAAYHFPGNIRELKSIIERAIIESGGKTIEAFHLHLLNERTIIGSVLQTESNRSGAEDLPLNLEQAEIELARRALAKAEGNVSKAAQLLGINRTKVYRILSQTDSES